MLDAWRLSFFWKRKRPAVAGSVWFGGTDPSAIYAEVAPRAFDTGTALKFLRAFQRHFTVDLGYVDVEHSSDFDDIERFNHSIRPFVIGLTSHRLREGLPAVPWAIFFGPPYVELFGRERLLSTPAASKPGSST